MGVAAGPGPPSCSLLAIGTPEGRQPEDHVVLGSLCLIPEQRFLSPGFQSRGVAGACLAWWLTVIGSHLDVTGPLIASVFPSGIKSLESSCVT